MFAFLFIVAFVAVVVFVINLLSKQPANESSNLTTIELSFGEKRDSHSNTFLTRIAGLTLSNTADDVGGYWGCIYHDKDNEYDPNAIAVLSVDGKLRGYIPKDETKDLRKWCNRNYLPCIFYIAEGDPAPLYGHVMVIDSDKEGVEYAMTHQTRWLVENFGVEFIPKDMGFTFDGKKPQTEQEWIDYLDEILDETSDKR